MTVIRPSSISGINSITANGGDINLFRADGTKADVPIINNITAGVVTATKFVGPIEGNLSNGTINATSGTITGNLGVGGVLTYEDVTNIDSVGVITARAGINVTGGVITGNGSGLTNLSVGMTTETISPSGITTHLLLSSADDHKVLATGNVTIDVTGGSEADNHQVRIENVGVATVGFSTAFKFPSGGTPSLPTASGSFSLITFTIHKVGAAGTILFAGASVNFS